MNFFSEKEIQRIIGISDERGDFVVCEDGDTYFWSKEGRGYLAAWQLRVLADELDRRNRINAI